MKYLKKYTNFDSDYFQNQEKNIERYSKLFSNAEDLSRNNF